MKNEFIISPITTYDEENELWETKIGVNTIGMPLYYVAYGKNKEESYDRAKTLVSVLSKKE